MILNLIGENHIQFKHISNLNTRTNDLPIDRTFSVGLRLAPPAPLANFPQILLHRCRAPDTPFDQLRGHPFRVCHHVLALMLRQAPDYFASVTQLGRTAERLPSLAPRKRGNEPDGTQRELF